MDDFRPLLMTMDRSMEKRVEVRVRAALVLCNLVALIHERMLLVPTDTKTMATATMGNVAAGAPRC